MTSQPSKIDQAAKDQIEKYFFSYYSRWRLARILSIKWLMMKRFDIFTEFVHQIRNAENGDGDETIAQEISNGLMASAVSECCEYVEDLFSLVSAAQNLSRFIQKATTYDAGRIKTQILSRRPFGADVQDLFLVPKIDSASWLNGTNGQKYDQAVGVLASRFVECQSFYRDSWFFHNQYKHGLSLALRPFSIFDDQLIERSKASPQTAYLVAFDNLSIRNVFDKQGRFRDSVMIACLTENTKGQLGQLNESDNLLRFFPYPPGGEIDIDSVVAVASTVASLLLVLQNNVLLTARGESRRCLPSDSGFLFFEYSSRRQ